MLPNGDVLVAESGRRPIGVRSLMDLAMNFTLRRVGASQPSANRITLLRDADGDGVPETREIFLEGLTQPFGMALVGDTFYVGNSDSVVAFPYVVRPDPHHRARPQADRSEAGRPLDAQSSRQQGWHQALYRRRLAEQYCR